MDTLADAVASLELDDNGSLPYGRSHWDGKPAELHAMILRAAGPLTLFINGLLGDNRRLDEATLQALWTDAINIDWQGDLALLPNIYLRAGGFEEYERPALNMLSLSVSRSMYDRLCTRFPGQATISLSIDAQYNQYQADINTVVGRIESTRLYHIPMHNGWFDLVDFSHPIALGWQAISYGHTALLKHLAEHHGVDLGKFHRLNGRLAMDPVAQRGHLDVLKMLHEAGSRSCSRVAVIWAAEKGHLHVIKWLHANRMEGCTTDAMDSAAENGHLDVVQWLHENRTEGCTTRAMDLAAENGHLHVVKWLHENQTEGCTTKAMDAAARKSHLDVVIWLHKNRTEGCTTDAMDCAAMSGNLEAVQWLHANRTEGCTSDAMDRAASYGHLDVVKWLHENRTEGCSTEAMDRAASYGHLDVVQWLHANRTEGCSTRAIDMAAEYGCLEVVQFLVACGYEFTFDALYRATNDAIIDVLVDSMTLARAKEMLQTARDEDGDRKLVARLERAVAEKQA